MYKYIILSILFILGVGCQNDRVISQADYFAIKNANLEKKYIALYPTSIEAMEIDFKMNYAYCSGFIDGLKDRFNNIKEVNKYLSKELRKGDIFLEEKLKWLHELKSKLNKDDFMYLFEYQDGNIYETGILVINNGEIKFRELYTTTNINAVKDEDSNTQ